MPYIFKEELGEGEDAVEVYTPEQYNALVEERDNLLAERDTLTNNFDAVSLERDNLSSQLVEAKTKFADAFLSSPAPKPPIQKEEPTYDKVDSFDSLFN